MFQQKIETQKKRDRGQRGALKKKNWAGSQNGSSGVWEGGRVRTGGGVMPGGKWIDP